MEKGANGEVEKLLFFRGGGFILTEEGMAVFFETKENALPPVVYELGQVGETERTLPVSFVLHPEGPDGQKEVSNDFNYLPIALPLNWIQTIHLSPDVFKSYFIRSPGEKQEFYCNLQLISAR